MGPSICIAPCSLPAAICECHSLVLLHHADFLLRWEQALYDARRAFEALVESAKCSGLSKAEMAHAGSSSVKQWQHRCAKAKLREAEALNALGRDPRPRE